VSKYDVHNDSYRKQNMEGDYTLALLNTGGYMAWINPNEYSFNSLLLLERFQIRLMMGPNNWQMKDMKWKENMGIALNANPAVQWYLSHRCPEYAELLAELSANAPAVTDAEQVRSAEVHALSSVVDWVTFTTPEVMSELCEWIYGWNKDTLFELVDLAGKTVLDVGAGSGRLAFAAAEKAAWVYASEPVETLREFMRDKIKTEGIKNVRVLDGLVTELPFPDDTFDVVMSGHVVGDDYDSEIAEITRVCKSGGWVLGCSGGRYEDEKPDPEEARARGYEEICTTSKLGKIICNQRLQVVK